MVTISWVNALFYVQKYPADIILLFPINSEMENHNDITFNSDDDVSVKVFFVDLRDIDESMKGLKEVISEAVYG